MIIFRGVETTNQITLKKNEIPLESTVCHDESHLNPPRPDEIPTATSLTVKTLLVDDSRNWYNTGVTNLGYYNISIYNLYHLIVFYDWYFQVFFPALLPNNLEVSYHDDPIQTQKSNGEIPTLFFDDNRLFSSSLSIWMILIMTSQSDFPSHKPPSSSGISQPAIHLIQPDKCYVYWECICPVDF